MARKGKKIAAIIAKRQRWYDGQNDAYKRANKRPGSHK